MTTTGSRSRPQATPDGRVSLRRQYRMYRFYAADGALLYLGITGRRPFKRLMEHVCDKPWAAEMARWEVDPRVWPDEPSMLAAEEAAIRRERPRYNYQHNHDNPDRVYAPAVRQSGPWRPPSARRPSTEPSRPPSARRPSAEPSLYARFWRGHTGRALHRWLVAAGRTLTAVAVAWAVLFAAGWWGLPEIGVTLETRQLAAAAAAVDAVGVLAWWRIRSPRRRRRSRRRGR